jgi:antitoxin FitA
MNTTILQVRDIPESVVATLRQRADREGLSLSAYVRNLLASDAEQPTMAETLARVATRTPVDISDQEILDAIHEGRR